MSQTVRIISASEDASKFGLTISPQPVAVDPFVFELWDIDIGDDLDDDTGTDVTGGILDKDKNKKILQLIAEYKKYPIAGLTTFTTSGGLTEDRVKDGILVALRTLGLYDIGAHTTSHKRNWLEYLLFAIGIIGVILLIRSKKDRSKVKEIKHES